MKLLGNVKFVNNLIFKDLFGKRFDFVLLLALIPYPSYGFMESE